MTVYCDTSVIVSVVVLDPHSDIAIAWLRCAQEPVIVSDLAALEFSAVVSRGLRTRRFALEEAAEALADFDRLREQCRRQSHGPEDFAVADSLIRDFSTKLAAADALHLAAAKNAGAVLATFDARLTEAARSRGVQVATIG